MAGAIPMTGNPNSTHSRTQFPVTSHPHPASVPTQPITLHPYMRPARRNSPGFISCPRRRFGHYYLARRRGDHHATGITSRSPQTPECDQYQQPKYFPFHAHSLPVFRAHFVSVSQVPSLDQFLAVPCIYGITINLSCRNVRQHLKRVPIGLLAVRNTAAADALALMPKPPKRHWRTRTGQETVDMLFF